MPEYAVQAVMAGYCSDAAIAKIDARLSKAGSGMFETSNGGHVSISRAPYSKYIISIWWPSRPNGS